MPRACVVVVDDEAGIREPLCEFLGETWDVACFRSGEEALEALACRSCALMVVDLMMPGMDGETLVEKAREAGLHVPVIVISARPDVDRVAASIGAISYLRKPFSLDALEQAVARALLECTP